MSTDKSEGVQSTPGADNEDDGGTKELTQRLQREHKEKYSSMAWWEEVGEIWKACQVPGYEISNRGRARGKFRVVYNGGKMYTQKAGILRSHEDKRGETEESGGYVFVRLSHKGDVRKYYIHQLVAFAFIGEKPTKGHTVDHINRVRNDNRPENIRWASKKEQNENRDLKVNRGERSNFSKLKKEDVIWMRGEYAKGIITYKQLAEKFGVSIAAIGRVICRKSWEHL